MPSKATFAVRKLIFNRTWQFLAELVVIVILSLYATTQFDNFKPNYHVGGLEAENVTSSAHFLYSAIHRWGYIPYWQPYSNKGQPFMDEAYNFLVNPFNFIPVVLFGDDNGVKVSVILHYIIVGIGGWYLAKSLGMGMIGRLVLGGLLIVKGNMAGTLGAGFIQLGLAQAYLPWVMAGALAVAHYPGKRWPPVLLAVSLALLYFCGTIFYILPAILLVIFTFLFYGFSIDLKAFRVRFDFRLLLRYIFAAILMVGLMAVTALTVGLNFGLIGAHPSQDVVVGMDIVKVFAQLFNPEMLYSGLFAEFSYSYVMPLWFIALLFVLIPPIRALHRGPDALTKNRLWWVVGFSCLFFFAWGLAIPPVPWIYATFPLISQWRYPERMLAVATFLLIFLVAYRIDGLERALRVNIRYSGRRTAALARLLAYVLVFFAAAFALNEVYQNNIHWGFTYPEDPNVDACVRWIIVNYPDQFLSIERNEFYSMATHIRNGVRMALIGAAYYVNGVPSTLYYGDLTLLSPPLYMSTWYETPSDLRAKGLIPVRGSPVVSLEYPDTKCLWFNPKATTYAFSIPLEQLKAAKDPFPTELATPVTYLGRLPEHIWLSATPSPSDSTVVVAQDVAYPGWTVQVDGQPAKLESVGKLLGVVLPPGSTPALVEFIYTAPTLKIGGMITLITAIATILYLLRAERLRKQGFSHWRIVQRLRGLRKSSANSALAVQSPLSVGASDARQRYRVNSGIMDVDASANELYLQSSMHVEAEYTVIRVIVPPSDKPTHVEIAYPTNAPAPKNPASNRGLLALIGAALVFLYLLATERRIKRPGDSEK